jgi:hypothetical protein
MPNPSTRERTQMRFWPFTRAKIQTPVNPVAVTDVAMPAPKNGHEQWSRVEGIIQGSISTVESVTRLQTAASTQLDAAGYSLHLLLAELSSVMPLQTPAHSADILRLEIPARANTAPAPEKDSVAA